MEDPLLEMARKTNFTWKINPANSLWRQGKIESRFKVLKRLIKISIGDAGLTLTELQTLLYKFANLSNERPIGVHRHVEDNNNSGMDPKKEVA